MNWEAIVTAVLVAAITTILGILVPYIITGIKKLGAYLISKTKNEKLKFLIEMATKVVEDCVVEANQTIVEGLKKSGTFDGVNAQEVKDKVVEAAKASLTAEQIEAIKETSALCVEEWIKQQVEVMVNKNK